MALWHRLCVIVALTSEQASVVASLTPDLIELSHIVSNELLVLLLALLQVLPIEPLGHVHEIRIPSSLLL